jgi:outer membrane protein OmpA-like peptidoglycan-associated protein
MDPKSTMDDWPILSGTVDGFGVAATSTTAEHLTPLLSAVAGLVTKCPVVSLRLVGHADATGPNPENAALGLRRAEWVKSALPPRPNLLVSVGSMGESMPQVHGASSVAQASNRRVEWFAGCDGGALPDRQ